jgi:hypothetical protein
MKTAKIKVVKPKGGRWVLDKKCSLLSIERALAALGYEMRIQTRLSKEEKA